jgi:hypothetical protein
MGRRSKGVLLLLVAFEASPVVLPWALAYSCSAAVLQNAAEAIAPTSRRVFKQGVLSRWRDCKRTHAGGEAGPGLETGDWRTRAAAVPLSARPS